ncbi:MAG: GTPase HflX [Treponema sp.]|nr:GTPase HflX [Treponema sp.]
MKKLHQTGPEQPRVFLAGIREHGKAGAGTEAEALMAELTALAETLELAVAGTEIVSVRERNPRYGMGSGRAEELAAAAREAGAECIVFNGELSPSRQRNWEDLAEMAVLDRQELIIRIFARRATTKEAELQAELARLLYMLPRLSHKYIDLSRQRGGRYGTRGSGETRLETDKRRIRERIALLRREIGEVRRNRAVQRKQRERQGTPVCALVGYTNAGKSSLHRALTGSEVLVEDKLFATLDPTARRVSRPARSGASAGARKNLVVVDTVGFIRALPHNLVDAFRSTLEEAARADLLVHVVDAADPARREQAAAVEEVLRELGAGEIPRITVFNKIDLLSKDEQSALANSASNENQSLLARITGNDGQSALASDSDKDGQPVPESAGASRAVSAKNRTGLEELWDLIEKTLKF